MAVHRTQEIAAVERRVASEPALELRDGGAVVLFGLGPCTVDTPGLASYRRDGAATGRQSSLVWRIADGISRPLQRAMRGSGAVERRTG
jgi:hypothetical protein